jgi:CRP-like cAMP-binding protein
MAPQRLARVILYLSSRFGKMGGGRVATMPAITHADLAKYVGTSRELISSHMNLMRRNGFIRYTRKEIEVNQDLRGYLNARPAEGD